MVRSIDFGKLNLKKVFTSENQSEDTFSGPFRHGTEIQWRVKEAYSVPINSHNTKLYSQNKLMIGFSTNRVEGTDFYLVVEGGDEPRYAIWNSQAWIFPDGHSGYGPYVLIDENVRKIFIQNGSHGVVDIVVYESF